MVVRVLPHHDGYGRSNGILDKTDAVVVVVVSCRGSALAATLLRAHLNHNGKSPPRSCSVSH